MAATGAWSRRCGGLCRVLLLAGWSSCSRASQAHFCAARPNRCFGGLPVPALGLGLAFRPCHRCTHRGRRRGRGAEAPDLPSRPDRGFPGVPGLASLRAQPPLGRRSGRELRPLPRPRERAAPGALDGVAVYAFGRAERPAVHGPAGVGDHWLGGHRGRLRLAVLGFPAADGAERPAGRPVAAAGAAPVDSHGPTRSAIVCQ